MESESGHSSRRHNHHHSRSSDRHRLTDRGGDESHSHSSAGKRKRSSHSGHSTHRKSSRGGHHASSSSRRRHKGSSSADNGSTHESRVAASPVSSTNMELEECGQDREDGEDGEDGDDLFGRTHYFDEPMTGDVDRTEDTVADANEQPSAAGSPTVARMQQHDDPGGHELNRPPKFLVYNERHGYWTPPSSFGHFLESGDANIRGRHTITCNRYLCVNIDASKFTPGFTKLLDFRDGSPTLSDGALSEIFTASIEATQTLLALIYAYADGTLPNGSDGMTDDAPDHVSFYSGHSAPSRGGRGRPRQSQSANNPHRYVYRTTENIDGATPGGSVLPMRTWGVEYLLTDFNDTTSESSAESNATLSGIRVWVFVNDQEFHDWKGLDQLMARNHKSRVESQFQCRQAPKAQQMSAEDVKWDKIRKFASGVATLPELAATYRTHENRVHTRDTDDQNISEMDWAKANAPLQMEQDQHPLTFEKQLDPFQDSGALTRGLTNSDGNTTNVWKKQLEVSSYFPWIEDNPRGRGFAPLKAIADRGLFYMLNPSIENPFRCDLPPMPVANKLAPPSLMYMFKKVFESNDAALANSHSQSALVSRCFDAYINDQPHHSGQCSTDVSSVKAIMGQMNYRSIGNETSLKRPMKRLQQKNGRIYRVIEHYRNQRQKAIKDAYTHEIARRKKEPHENTVKGRKAAQQEFFRQKDVHKQNKTSFEPRDIEIKGGDAESDHLDDSGAHFFLVEDAVNEKSDCIKQILSCSGDMETHQSDMGLGCEDLMERRLKVLNARLEDATQSYLAFGIDSVKDLFSTESEELPAGYVHAVKHAFKHLHSRPTRSGFFGNNPDEEPSLMQCPDLSAFGHWVSSEMGYAHHILRFRERPPVWLAMYLKSFERLIMKSKYPLKTFGHRGCGKSFAMNQLTATLFDGTVVSAGTDSNLAGRNGTAKESGHVVGWDEQPSQTEQGHIRLQHYKEIVTNQQVTHRRAERQVGRDGIERVVDVCYVTDHQEVIYIASNQPWLNGKHRNIDPDVLAWVHRNVHIFFREKGKTAGENDSVAEAQFEHRMQSGTGKITLNSHRHMQSLMSLLLPLTVCIPGFETSFDAHDKIFGDMDAYLLREHGIPKADDRGIDCGRMIAEVTTALNALYMRFYCEEYAHSKLFDHIDPSEPFNLQHLRSVAPLLASPTPEISVFTHALQAYTRPNNAPVFHHVAQAMIRHVGIEPQLLTHIPLLHEDNTNQTQGTNALRNMEPFWTVIEEEAKQQDYIDSLSRSLTEKRENMTKTVASRGKGGGKQNSSAPLLSELLLRYNFQDVGTVCQSVGIHKHRTDAPKVKASGRGWCFAAVQEEDGRYGNKRDHSKIWVGDMGESYQFAATQLCKELYMSRLRIPEGVVADALYLIATQSKVEYLSRNTSKRPAEPSRASEQAPNTDNQEGESGDNAATRQPTEEEAQRTHDKHLGAAFVPRRNIDQDGQRKQSKKKKKAESRNKHAQGSTSTEPMIVDRDEENDGESRHRHGQGSTSTDPMLVDTDDATKELFGLNESQFKDATKFHKQGLTNLRDNLTKACELDLFPALQLESDTGAFTSVAPFQFEPISDQQFAAVSTELTKMAGRGSARTNDGAQTARGTTVLAVDAVYVQRRAKLEITTRLVCSRNPQIKKALDPDFREIEKIENPNMESCPFGAFYDMYNYALTVEAAKYCVWKRRKDESNQCVQFVTPFGVPNNEHSPLMIDMTETAKRKSGDPGYGIRPQAAEAKHNVKTTTTLQESINRDSFALLTGKDATEEDLQRCRADFKVVNNHNSSIDPYVSITHKLLRERGLLGRALTIKNNHRNLVLIKEAQDSNFRRLLIRKGDRKEIAKKSHVPDREATGHTHMDNELAVDTSGEKAREILEKNANEQIEQASGEDAFDGLF